MKVVQINQTYGIGDSTGRTTMEMHKYLETKKIDSVVYCCDVLGEVQYDKNVQLFESRFERKIHALLSRISGRQAHFSHIATKGLINKLKKEKMDVVILRILHGNIIHFPMLMRALKKMDCKVFLILHDCWYYTGHCWYYTKAKCDKWKSQCGHCTALNEGNVSWIWDQSQKDFIEKKQLYDDMSNLYVVGVSKWITNEARSSILKDANISHIYNWIDFKTFYPRMVSGTRDKKVVLGVSSYWTKNKGWDDMLYLAGKLPEVEFRMVGKVLENVEIPKNMKLLGTIGSADRLAELYSEVDVFVNPSRQETFGKTTAEAFCCGTPVVVYNTTACAELVDETRGDIIALGEKELLLEGVKKVLELGREHYSDSCVEFARDNFSYEVNMEKYLDLMK